MKTLIALCMMLLLASGCFRSPAPTDASIGVDPRSLPPISETAKLSIGMHEREASKILGQPYKKEPGFYGGQRLWYKLYNPSFETMPSHFLVTTDKNGFITFISKP